MKWTHAGSALALAVAVMVGAASCSNSESTTGPSASSGGGGGGGGLGVGTLRVLITDSPFTDAQAVLVKFMEVSVHRTGAAWQRLDFADASTQRTCDLKRLEEVTDLLGVGQLEAGHYTQLRLEVATGTLHWQNKSVGPPCAPAIIVLGTNSDVTIPSGTIHLNRQFTIEPGQTTTIELDFDGDASIKQTGNGKYMMQPVIAVTAVTTGSGQ